MRVVTGRRRVAVADALDFPTRSATPTRSAQATSSPASSTTRTRTLSTPSRSAGRTQTQTKTTVRTQTATATATRAAATSTTAASTAATTAAAAAPTTAASPAAAADKSSATPAWVWWVIGLVALAVVLTVVLLVRRRRRRRAWGDQFTAAQGEVAWFARGLVPELGREPTVQQIMGGWRIEAGRVSSVEDRLTTLAASGPDDPASARARTLRDAVRAGRQRLDGMGLAADAPDVHALLWSVAELLEAALASVAPGGAPPVPGTPTPR